MGNSALSWSCVCCGHAIGPARPDACSVCGTATRSILGVPILTSRPQTSLDALRVQLAMIGATQPVNLEALARVWDPALAQAAGLPQRPSNVIIDCMARLTTGWGGASRMLPFLYIDWADTEEFRASRALFLDAVLRHCP